MLSNPHGMSYPHSVNRRSVHRPNEIGFSQNELSIRAVCPVGVFAPAENKLSSFRFISHPFHRAHHGRRESRTIPSIAFDNDNARPVHLHKFSTILGIHKVALFFSIPVQDAGAGLGIVGESVAFIRGLRTDYVPSHTRGRRFLAHGLLPRRTFVIRPFVCRRRRLDRPWSVPEQEQFGRSSLFGNVRRWRAQGYRGYHPQLAE